MHEVTKEVRVKGIIALILLLIYTVFEYAAYIPQIVKLIKTKSADDLSITTWITWVIASVCYLMYVLLECPDWGIIFVASMNILFVITVCVLTTYYQANKKTPKREKKRQNVQKARTKRK